MSARYFVEIMVIVKSRFFSSTGTPPKQGVLVDGDARFGRTAHKLRIISTLPRRRPRPA